MSTEEKPELNNAEKMDSASRRDFMKVAGVGALGLAYSHPVVETLRCQGHMTGYSGKPHRGSGTHPHDKPSNWPPSNWPPSNWSPRGGNRSGYKKNDNLSS